MPIIEAAFRDAQAASLAAYKRACADGVRRDERDIIEARALLTAYLSHPSVDLAVYDAADEMLPHEHAERQATAILQAIGAKP